MREHRREALAAPEPDYRFTLANERTFLAWIRTSLAMSACAGGLLLFGTADYMPAIATVSAALGATATGMAIDAAVRWRQNDTAIRLGQGLPRLAHRSGVTSAVVVIVGGCLLAAASATLMNW